MNAVVTVIGKDTVGIIAGISSLCALKDANIVDITQSVLGEYFAMIMLINIEKLSVPFSEFVDLLNNFGKEKSLEVHTVHEDIFNSMHHI
ncbi:ACT domain-containing protein [bacterium]|nr:ACT domain-containing protein [bacterium]